MQLLGDSLEYSNSHHSPFLHHRSNRTLDSRNTWVQRRKFKNDQHCVCQRKPHVICHFRTWDDGTIKIWHPGDSAIFIRYVWICKAALTGIWDPGGIILENLTASWGEKARKCGEATSTSTVRSFDKESEPLVEMGNTKGNDGLKPWCNSKRQIQDSCLSKAVKYSRFEAADMGSRTKNDATRIKGYRLKDDGKWDDQGTGHVTVDYLERFEELGLFVVDEEDHETLLMHHISSIDIYWNQEDTIISWRDPEYSTELALSFQEPAGCSYIWDQISSVQRHLNFNSLSNDSYHSVSSELRELPAVELSTLPLILKTVVESGIAAQMRITKLILHDQDFFRKLMEVFRVCEDLENVDGLHVIFKMVGGIILLNSPRIFEKIFGDEFIMDIIGSLEYDPDIPHVQHHRCFLKEHVVFKEALPIKDPVVLSKIHQTYRVGYLKDVILKRALDVATIANLNSIIHSNNAIVVSLLKDDSTFIQELFARLRSSTTSMKSKKNLVLFLHEFCSLSKSLQMVQQHWLYRDLVNEGKFGIIGDVLRNQDKKLVLIGTDILILFLNQDPNLSRSHVTRQERIPLIGLLVRGSLRETIIEIFYEKRLGQLIEVITSSCSPTSVGQSVREFTDFNGSTDMIPTKPEILLNICELLCFCVLRHQYRIKCNFLLNNVIHKVLSLTRRRGKYLVVAVVRFLRTLISHSDEHLMNHIARNNLLKPIFHCVLQKLVGSDDLDEV